MGINDPKLYPIGLLARRLRVPVAWLREEANAGRIPHLRAGPRLLFDPEIVEHELLKRARGNLDEALKQSKSTP